MHMAGHYVSLGFVCYSNSLLGGQRKELTQTLPHARTWARYEKWLSNCLPYNFFKCASLLTSQGLPDVVRLVKLIRMLRKLC